MSSSVSVRRLLLIGALAAGLVACADESGKQHDDAAPPSAAAAAVPSSLLEPPATTLPAASLPATTALPRPTTTAIATTAPPPTLPALGSGQTPHRVPIGDGVRFSYGRTHGAGYPASDIFAGCGAPVVSPVTGTILEVRRVDEWSQALDNPATRGGRSVTILGDDGVRYYVAHLDLVEATLEPGQWVAINTPLGTQGTTGRSGECHTHFSISPLCPGKEWKVRRGVIWPWGYLDAWRDGKEASPVEEIRRWLADHPNGCAEAMADPNAADS